MILLGELLEHTRSTVLRDVPQPWLFSDEELERHLIEAYKLFARRTHVFVEPDFEIETIADERTYQLPQRCIYVRDVSIDGCALGAFTRSSRPRAFRGRPIAYSTDSAQTRIKFYPVPDRAYFVDIDYVTLPDTSGVAADIEVRLAEDWAYGLCFYAAGRALRNNDPDGSNTIAGDTLLADFNQLVRQVKVDIIRERTGEGARVRAPSWT